MIRENMHSRQQILITFSGRTIFIYFYFYFVSNLQQTLSSRSSLPHKAALKENKKYQGDCCIVMSYQILY